MAIKLLGGGAAKDLVNLLSDRFEKTTGAAIRGEFGPVGGMRDRVRAGEEADVLILSRKLMEELVEAGHLDGESITDVGPVATGVATRSVDTPPICDTPDALRRTLLESDGIFFPDPEKATAGIHFDQVLRRLGMRDAVDDRLSTHPGGQAAMQAMAASDCVRPVGCTQVTEILGTEGVSLVALLPEGYDLTTIYTAGVMKSSAQQDHARALIDLITAPETRDVRDRVGFGS